LIALGTVWTLTSSDGRQRLAFEGADRSSGLRHAEHLAEFCGRYSIGGADSDEAAGEVSAFRQLIGVCAGKSQRAGSGRDADDRGKGVEVLVLHGLNSDASVAWCVAVVLAELAWIFERLSFE
jgi:hypothetical protein